MPTIADIKKQFPDLSESTDDEVVDALHQAFYADLPREKVAERLGVKLAPPTAPEAKPRTLGAVANDTVIEAANAVAGGVKSVADFISPGNRMSRFIEDNIIRPGEESQSDVAKQSRQQFQQEVDSADGILGELGAVGRKVLRDPLLTAAQAAGSFVVPGSAVKAGAGMARLAGAGAKGVTRAGLAGGAAAGGALSGGDAGGQAYDLVIQAGGTPEQATDAARQASMIPAAVGAAGGLVGAERLVAGAKGFSGGAMSRVLKTGAVEGAQEGLEEGVTQFEAQRAAMPYDPSIDPSKGVAAAAGMGAAMGGAIGGGTAVLHGGHKTAGDVIREDLQPNVGPLTRAVNAGVETAAQAADAALPEDGTPQSPRAANADMIARIRRLDPEAQQEALRLHDLGNRMDVAPGVRRYAQNRLDAIMGDGQPLNPPEKDEKTGKPIAPETPTVADPKVGDANDQSLARVESQLRADEAAQAEAAAEAEKQAKKEAKKAKPKADIVSINPPTTEDEYRAWKETNDEVVRGMNSMTPEEKQAFDAAWAQREADRPPEPTGTVQPGDILNKQDRPFRSMAAAMLAKKNAGDGHEIVRVAQGLVVRSAKPLEAEAPAPKPASESVAAAPVAPAPAQPAASPAADIAQESPAADMSTPAAETNASPAPVETAAKNEQVDDPAAWWTRATTAERGAALIRAGWTQTGGKPSLGAQTIMAKPWAEIRKSQQARIAAAREGNPNTTTAAGGSSTAPNEGTGETPGAGNAEAPQSTKQALADEQQAAGGNVHAWTGRSDFKRGMPRELPSYFTDKNSANAKQWFKGWDAAKAEGAKPEPALDRRNRLIAEKQDAPDEATINEAIRLDVRNPGRLTRTALLAEIEKAKQTRREKDEAIRKEIEAEAAPAPAKRKPAEIVDNGATNPGEFIVHDPNDKGGQGTYLASFKIGANGRPTKVKHFFESQGTRDHALASIDHFLAKRAKAAAPSPAAEPAEDPAVLARMRVSSPYGKRWPYPIVNKNPPAGLVEGQRAVVDYMNGDITKPELLAALGATPLPEGTIGGITMRLGDDFLEGDIKKVLALQEAGKTKAAAPAPANDATIVGRRADGVMIRKDERGVRFYAKDGVRIFETVGLRPSRSGMQIERGELKPEFMTAEESTAAAPAPAAAPAASANTIFTADAAEKARAILRKKLGNLNSGIDPELLGAGLTLAGYHIEAGARSFAAYAKAMVADMGEGIKPYLKSFYMAVKFDPRASTLEGMSTSAEVEAADVDAVSRGADPIEPAAPAADTEGGTDGNATQQLDQPSAGALEGAPSQDVRAPDESGNAGTGPDGRGGSDGGGNAGTDLAGDRPASGLGADARDVPVPARGTRKRAKAAPEPGLFGPQGTDAGPEQLRPERGGLTPEGGENPAPNGPAIPAPQFKAEDFTLDESVALGEGGQKTKFKANVAAIRLVRDLEATGRMATPEEQVTLAKYVGWGGISQAFDPENADWSKEHAELKALMSQAEFDAAARSTRYAHYTSREIIVDGVYAALRRFGFTGGKTLEAGAGVGNFIGMMPADMRSAGRFTAIEREPFSGAIARHLYPKQNVQQADFTEFRGQDGYYDAAVGNPPFASDPQTDRSGRKHLSGLTLHNYFFAKAVDMLREGGILAQVITNGFMDAKTDTARKYIGERTRLLGAIRLPNNAFSKNANTEVTTDLVFLQKLPDSEIGSKAAKLDAKRWLDAIPYTDEKGAQVLLNRYFVDNPSMMLGKFGTFGTMYGPDKPALVARPGQDTAALLKAAVERMPEGVFKSLADTGTTSQVQAAIIALKNPPVRENGYYLDGDKLIQRVTDIAGEARGVEITADSQWTAKTKLGEAGLERIKALAGMRGTVRALIAAEMADDDKGMGTLRAKLNEQYDAYRDTHGLLNDPSTLRVFDDDPDYPLLASLEIDYKPGIGPAAAKAQGIKPTKSSAKKSAIFDRRVVAARTAVRKVDNAVDALAVSMAERGKLDAAYIGELLGKDPEAVLKELSSGDKPALFRDPASNEYVLRDAYLSGNVRAKLAQAKEAGMVENARALEEVQPADVSASEITARIGSPWVPEKAYEDFAAELFGEGAKARVQYIKLNSSYQFDVRGGSEVALNNTWGTSRMPGDKILSALLNNKPIKVVDYDSDGKPHTNVEATEAANLKAQDIKDRFGDWLFKDADRAESLVRAYNDTNNNYVTREYDGAPMTFPGKVPNEIIRFRRHQRNAIARTVQDRTALYDHVVGAGKTYTVIASAMELKRTGLAKKPMVAVPNHLVKQWAADFYRLYPGANILTATKKDFQRENRRKFLAKIATGDWDAVVIAHSSFGFIKPAPEFEAEFNAKQIADIVATIKAVEDSDGDGPQKKRTVKQLEGLKERLENRIKSLRDKPLDDLLDFQQIGVDQLFVDEAHMFKNLMFSTKMQNVQGLGDSKGSQRAYDMFVKVNQIFAQNGRGQGVVFATGTPVSNSLAEMYHMMRYLMPAQMEELGFGSFDAWANTFAAVDQVWMQKPSGDGFKASNRMANFVNTTELLKMFDQVCDTVTMDDIKAAFREENPGQEFPLPKLKTGRRQPVSLEKSAAQDAYMKEIADRAKAIEARKGPPQKGDDNILVVMGDARKAAMDIRLVDPDATEREKGGRIDRAANEIIDRYQKYDAVRGTQLVFSDMGTPIKQAKKELGEYEALRQRIDAATEDVQASAALGDEAAKEVLEDAEAAQEEIDAKGRDWLDAIKAALRGFSVYDDLKAALIERGIPENEIAFIHDYNTDDQKAGLFKKVNSGQIRVLIGSTQKMGAGTNVQERLVALHHLDVPWRPSDVEQREGRIERQGNVLAYRKDERSADETIPGFEIEILGYVTKDTLDQRMWQVQEVKLKMINQLRTRKIDRNIDNAFEDLELSAGEMQAAATGNVDLLKEITLRNDVKKLEQKQRAFDAQKSDLVSRRNRAERTLTTAPKEVEKWKPWAKAWADYKETLKTERPVDVTVNGKTYTSRTEAQTALRELVDAHEAKIAARKETIDAADEAVKKEFPGEDGESGYNRKAAWEKIREANPMPKLGVEFNGKTYNSKAAVAEAFVEATGDAQRFDWTFGGKDYIHQAKAATAIGDAVMEAGENDTRQEVGGFGPFKVSVEGVTTKSAGTRLDVIVSYEGKEVGDDIGFRSISEVEGAASSNARNVMDKAESILRGADSRVHFAEVDQRRAEKAIAELDAADKTDGEWPDKAKLDAARKAHREVLDRLSAKPAAAAEDGEAPSLSIDGGLTGADNQAYGPATQAHRDLADKLGVGIARRYPGTVFYAVAPRVGQGGRASELTAVATVAKRLFGHEVIFVKFAGQSLFNGAMADNMPGKVFLRADSPRPLMAVLGHELLHQLRASNPGIYAALNNRLTKVIKNGDRYTAALQARYTARGASSAGVKFDEELHADIVGDFFMDDQFWKDMAAEQPGLFKRVANAILKFLDNAIEQMGGPRPFGTDQYLTDIKAARAAVADAMRQFSGTQVGAMTSQSEGVNLSIADALTDKLNSAADVKLPAGYIVADLFDRDGKLGWWHKSVGTMSNLAKRSVPFKRVYDGVQNFLNDVSSYATEAADLAPRILPKLETWKDIAKSPLSPEDTRAIGAPIWSGTLTWARDERGRPVKMSDLLDKAAAMPAQDKARELLRTGHISEGVLKMWQGLALDQYESLVNGKYERDILKAGVVWSDAELRDMFKLNAKQIELYREFRAATDRSLHNLAVSDMLRFGGDDVAPMRTAALRARTVDEAAELLRDHLFAMAEANPDRADVLNDTGNKMIDKADRATDLMKRGYAPLSRFGTYTLDVVAPDGERLYFGMFESTMERSRMARQMRSEYPDAQISTGTVSQEAHKLFAGVSPETLELFGDMLGLESQGDGAANKAFQTYIKLARSNRSAMKRLIERKGIAGFNEDAGRVLAGFVYSNARQTSSNLHMGEVTAAANEIPQGQGELKDAAVRLTDYVKNPQEEAQAIRGLLFAQYLGGSVASAMVNLTQPLAVTFPYLSQYGGVAKAAKQMAAAVKDANKKTTGDAALDKALKHAEETGIVSPQEVHQLMAQAQGRSALKSGDGTLAGNALATGSNALSKLGLAWGKVFGLAEQYNRRVTFIAAYRTAVDQGIARPAAFAEQAVADTQFTYNKGNKPKWARGAVGGTLFTFKQYSVNYVQLLQHMWANGGPEGKKAALLALAVMFLLSGADGLPFAEDIEDVIDGVLQRMGYNFSTKASKQAFFASVLGRDGGRLMEKGISGLPGVPIDLSGRLGLGNLIPGTGLFVKKADHTRDLLELAGPAGDLAKRAAQAGGLAVAGEFGEAVRTIAPVAARNVYKAVDMASTGMYRDERGRKVLDVDGYEAIAKGIGFQPNSVARVQEATGQAQQMIAQAKLRETEIADQWAQAMFEKDAEGVKAAKAALARWNDNNPTSPIKISYPQILKRLRAMNMDKATRIAKTAPAEIRSTVRRELAGASE